MSSVLIALRRLRDDRAAAIAVALVVLVTATIFAAAPRLLDRIGDAALQDTIRGAASFDRTLAVIEEQPIAPGGATDPLAGVDAEGDRLGARFPASIQGIVDERTTVVDTMRFALKAETPDPTFVRFRIQPGAEARIHWVAGRAPARRRARPTCRRRHHGRARLPRLARSSWRWGSRPTPCARSGTGWARRSSSSPISGTSSSARVATRASRP
jgi:hypothetical protein